jgi:hypothetical protein
MFGTRRAALRYSGALTARWISRRTHRGEAILGHMIGGIAGIYQKDDFAEEIPAALIKLANHIEAIVAGPVEKVKKTEPRTERRRRLSKLLLRPVLNESRPRPQLE